MRGRNDRSCHGGVLYNVRLKMQILNRESVSHDDPAHRQSPTSKNCSAARVTAPCCVIRWATSISRPATLNARRPPAGSGRPRRELFGRLEAARQGAERERQPHAALAAYEQGIVVAEDPGRPAGGQGDDRLCPPLAPPTAGGRALSAYGRRSFGPADRLDPSAWTLRRAASASARLRNGPTCRRVSSWQGMPASASFACSSSA
jgi:hypothetical protein